MSLVSESTSMPGHIHTHTHMHMFTRAQRKEDGFGNHVVTLSMISLAFLYPVVYWDVVKPGYWC